MASVQHNRESMPGAEGNAVPMLPLGCRRHLGPETPLWYNCHMAVLNLRGVPDELAQRLKADAALAGVSLRDYCVRLLSGRGVVVGTQGCNATLNLVSQDAPAKHREIVQTPESSAPSGDRRIERTAGTGLADASAALRSEGDSQSRPISCPTCGALRGHQKWCKSRR